MARVPTAAIRSLRLLVMALVAIGPFHAGEALAAPITFQFTGSITSVTGDVGSMFAVGDTVSITYTFESTTAPRAGANSTEAVYDALTSLSFSTSGGYSGSSSGAPEIQVENDKLLDPGNPPLGFFPDRYAVVSRTADGLVAPSVNGYSLLFMAMVLRDSTNTAFSDALVLPTTLSLADFTSADFGFEFLDALGNPGSVQGEITAVNAVPEPATLLLLGSGLAAAAQARRRNRRT